MRQVSELLKFADTFSKTICKTNIYSLQTEHFEVLNNYIYVFTNNNFFMKKKFLLFAFSAILLASCNNENTGGLFQTDDEEVAIELLSHVKRVESVEFINDSEYEEFLTPKIRSMISKDRQAMKRVGSATNTDVDTIYSLSDIPVIKEIISKNIIYVSGEMLTETQDITLEEENILNTMTATPLLPEQTIKKTVSKDGMLTSYGADGNILSSEPYEEPNMKPFLDSLKYYVDLAEKELSKQEVKSQSAFAKIKSSAMPNGTNVWQMDDGNIVIEEIISNHSENGMRVKGVDGQMRSRTITNPEMDKTLRFELYQGNQMVTRRTYQYNGSEKLKNSVKIKGSTIENPSGIISEVLFINERGIPRIRKTQEEYKQNQMIVHF